MSETAGAAKAKASEAAGAARETAGAAKDRTAEAAQVRLALESFRALLVG